jgi:hypothetical protein
MGAQSILKMLPGRYAQIALRLRDTLAPQPSAGNAAAVELYRAQRASKGILPYPQYLYGLLSAARTAQAVGAESFTAIECGVAGGNGLRALEQHAEYIEQRYPVSVSVYGFDSGRGMLTAADPRDCAFALPPGEFAMDEQGLRDALRQAELVLGKVEETVPKFMHKAESSRLPRIGFVSIDLDVFTGTLAVLRALEAHPDLLLPRVAMYFDDLAGYPYTSEDGEWAAITTFNASSNLKIGRVDLQYQLGGASRGQSWPTQTFVLHTFDDPAYNAREHGELPRTTLRQSSALLFTPWTIEAASRCLGLI